MQNGYTIIQSANLHAKCMKPFKSISITESSDQTLQLAVSRVRNKSTILHDLTLYACT